MSIGREIEDIARDLIKHQHDHPPVRDLNREVERKLTFADRVAADFARLVGSWVFVLAQVGIMVLWVGLNAFNLIHPWDHYPFLFLNFILSLEAAIWVSVVLMALNLAVEVSDRGVVVLVLDQVPGDVFDFSADRHGSFLWGCCDECRGSVRMHSLAQKTPIWLRKVSLGLQTDRAPHQEHRDAPPPIFARRAVHSLVRRRRFADCLNHEPGPFQRREIGLQRVGPAREMHVQSVTIHIQLEPSPLT